MCGSDNNNIPRAFNSVYGMNFEEIFNPKAPGDEFGIMPPQECFGFDPRELIPNLKRSAGATSNETREELAAKVRQARQRRRENDEPVAKPTGGYPGTTKQPWKTHTKDFARNKSKDKRKQNYAFSRRE